MSITKIAAITGASVSTVARVLRDPEHKCHSMELKERILQTAREIGYVPNEAAKALKSGSAPKKIFHINILLTRVNSDETDPFYPRRCGPRAAPYATPRARCCARLAAST